jgi:hypothetical protein
MFDDSIRAKLQAAPFNKIMFLWQIIIEEAGDAGRAWLGRNDRFYLLTNLLHRPDAIHPWLYARCREVEAQPDECLDLWAREHYKSTIITFAGIIQEILKDKEITIAVFSHTKGVARKFVQQVKYELETNHDLKRVYPDVLFENPQKESPQWSLDGGIVVRRDSNPKEMTLEGHGLVDGMPTGAHFRLRVYDDVVTPASVTTPEQVQKTTEAWSLSDNLGAVTVLPDGREIMRRWHIGTRYSFADTYQHILDKKILIPRVYAATDDATAKGNPVFLSNEIWQHKLKTQLESDIACQQLQNPTAGSQVMFKKEHLKFTDIRPATLNIYILVDPASSKKKGSDRTAIAAIAVDAARNKYLIDGCHHKMNLQERWTAMSQLRKHWQNQPGIQSVHVGYERYGMRSDIEYFEEKMLATNDSFTITELAWPTEGPGSKYDRIQRLYPDFSQGKFFLIADHPDETSNQRRMREDGQPFRILKPVKRRDHEGNIYALNKGFLDEYLFYPFSVHDDFLDSASRLYDMDYQPPVIIDERHLEPEVFIDG